jgi:hypothetical protein
MAATFFGVAGLLEIGLAIGAAPALSLDRLWEAVGRACLYLLVAWGLTKRLAVCRSIAMVYCLAALTTYAIVLALALGHAPFRFPPGLVVQSLFEVPSCAALLPYLRSREASAAFARPLF